MLKGVIDLIGASAGSRRQIRITVGGFSEGTVAYVETLKEGGQSQD